MFRNGLLLVDDIIQIFFIILNNIFTQNQKGLNALKCIKLRYIVTEDYTIVSLTTQKSDTTQYFHNTPNTGPHIRDSRASIIVGAYMSPCRYPTSAESRNRDNGRHSDTTRDKDAKGSHEIQGVGTGTRGPEVKRGQNTIKYM